MKINKMLGTQGRFQVKVLGHYVLPNFDLPELETLMILDLHEGGFVGSDQIPFDELSILLKIRNDDDLQRKIESLNAVVTCAEKNDYSAFFGYVMASVPVGSYDESDMQRFSKFYAFLANLVDRIANPVDAEYVAKNIAAVDNEPTLMMFYADNAVCPF